MTTADDLESHLTKLDLPYERVGDGTWLVSPSPTRPTRIGIHVQDPVVVFSVPICTLSHAEHDPAGFFRRLLELNAELLHSSYALEGDRIVLSGAHPLANLDFNEFQAMIDDMSMALDHHGEALSRFFASKVRTSEEN